MPRKEPLITSPIPDYPWQKVGSDLSHLKRCDYLVIVASYIEVIKLGSNISASEIEAF